METTNTTGVVYQPNSFSSQEQILSRGPFYWITLIPAWISNHMPTKVWGEITYPFPNFNGATVEVWKWICIFIPHFIMDMIT